MCITGDPSGSGDPFEICLIEKSGTAVLGQLGIGMNANGTMQLVPFIQDFNQEILIVKGLPVGNYELVIDGVSVQTASANELTQGINLAVNEKTPQYMQALEAKANAQKRHSIISGTLRSIEYVWHSILSKIPGLERDDFEGAKKALEMANENFKKTNFTYGISQNTVYIKNI